GRPFPERSRAPAEPAAVPRCRCELRTSTRPHRLRPSADFRESGTTGSLLPLSARALELRTRVPAPVPIPNSAGTMVHPPDEECFPIPHLPVPALPFRDTPSSCG